MKNINAGDLKVMDCNGATTCSIDKTGGVHLGMSEDKMIDLMYMYGADVAQKIDQIVSLEIFGSIDKSHKIMDVQLSFYDAVTKDTKYLVTLEDGKYYVIENNPVIFKLDSHITNLLETVDDVLDLNMRGIKVDYNSIIAQMQAQTLNLLEASMYFIREC